jgi:thiamine-phosphate pyrophosphorylase
LGVGPMYATLTKLDAQEVQGPKIIHDMRQSRIAIPIVGIGGITMENAQAVIDAGADGVAVVSAISLSISPVRAAAEILHKVNGCLSK